ncbi:hypothetical protein HS961_02130 [Comamonas piscis]|uniref:Lipoprotein n=1 Tax=Comamonas piscis TaxID=1562974 RepID=A0A7G5ECK2_9BURK|nr:hypothetical protein [Comamonas piscis]QMV71727.1 hypothetical protein HS961_02130 [Comamonas piscis]WSO34450.1 hypothetical protein VUJ63_02145 [Comamonas piscis]
MLKKWIAIGALLGTGMAQAYMPQSGTWVVTSELNGKPGRGLAIDVQNQTLVMQMYAYDASGNATFYLTSGAYKNNQYSGTLNKYRGGRYLGSNERIGQDNGNDGVVSMRFESGTKGYIKFPGEAEKEISRFSFGYDNSPQSLFGMWLFTSLGASTASTDFVRLEKLATGSGYGTGFAATSNYRFGCEHLTSGPNAGLLLCLKLNAADRTEQVYYLNYAVNDGEGVTGATPETATKLLVVRRLTTNNDDGTGILLKDAEAQTPADPEALRQALADAAAQPNEQ